MWLLDTESLELCRFGTPPDNEQSGQDGYAILSHVWDPNGEQSFQVSDLTLSDN